MWRGAAVVLALLQPLSRGVEITSLTVPGAPPALAALPPIAFLLADLLPVGSRAAFTCQFRLPHNQFMDSVKWYLNQSEIYRIVPSLAQDRQVACCGVFACYISQDK